MKALRLVMIVVSIFATLATVWQFGAGAGSVVGLVTLIPLWAIAAFADWRLSGRWDRLFGVLTERSE